MKLIVRFEVVDCGVFNMFAPSYLNELDKTLETPSTLLVQNNSVKMVAIVLMLLAPQSEFHLHCTIVPILCYKFQAELQMKP